MCCVPPSRISRLPGDGPRLRTPLRPSGRRSSEDRLFRALPGGSRKRRRGTGEAIDASFSSRVALDDSDPVIRQVKIVLLHVGRHVAVDALLHGIDGTGCGFGFFRRMASEAGPVVVRAIFHGVLVRVVTIEATEAGVTLNEALGTLDRGDLIRNENICRSRLNNRKEASVTLAANLVEQSAVGQLTRVADLEI